MQLARVMLPILLATIAVLPGAQAAQTNAPAAPATPIKVDVIASGLDRPWGIEFLPDGSMLVTEKPGRLRIVTADGELSKPIAGVPEVHASGQGGLLDVRLAPDFASSGTIYLSYAEPRGWFTSATAVARARLVFDKENGSGRLDGLKVIFQQQPEQRTSHHYGSRIVPVSDGTLFITTGERGNAALSQDPGAMLGKVIRINPDGSIPADNPQAKGWAPGVWSFGHRNIQGAAIDPATGRLWTVEHGARDDQGGRIQVELLDRGDSVEIVVEDNGLGLPPDFDPAQGHSLGLQIVHTLVTDDLKGEFRLESITPDAEAQTNGDGCAGGTRAIVTFPKRSLRAD